MYDFCMRCEVLERSQLVSGQTPWMCRAAGYSVAGEPKNYALTALRLSQVSNMIWADADRIPQAKVDSARGAATVNTVVIGAEAQ